MIDMTLLSGEQQILETGARRLNPLRVSGSLRGRRRYQPQTPTLEPRALQDIGFRVEGLGRHAAGCRIP